MSPPYNRLDWQARVRAFHLSMDVTVADEPTIPDDAVFGLRAALVREEADELIRELRPFVGDAHDLPSIAKEMADLIYVVLGTAVSLGIDMAPVFQAVHESNMAKAAGPVRADGKRLKPEGWEPPDIAAILYPRAVA